VGAHRFYDRKEIKDIIAYLRLACNSNDGLSFRKVINVPRRGIGEKTIEKIDNYAGEQGLPVLEVLVEPEKIPGISNKMSDSLQQFYGMIKYFGSLTDSGAPLRDIIDAVIEMSGYINELKKSELADAQARIENIQELKSLAIEFEKEGGAGLEDFLAQIALTQDTDNLDYNDAVFLMTYHGAKGLEFPVVFMTGMEEGVFPSYRTESVDELQEERRLCYVGITRAQERLYLTNAVSRLLYGYERNNPPSRFLKEIPEELLASPHVNKPVRQKLEEGDKVIHRKFGMGNITSLTEDGIAIIDFERAGVRMLRLDIAPLEKISG
jgi:DNA helicase-2/ATP-dependent DNA helicase PcrA